jgi:hypothetical protein
VSFAIVDLRHGGRDPRRPPPQTCRLEGGQRPVEVHPGLHRPKPAPRHPTRLLFQCRLGKWVVGELGCLGEVPLGLLVRSEGGSTHSGTGKPLAGRRTNLSSIRGAGGHPVGIEVVRGNHLDDLLLSERPLEVRRGGQVSRLPVDLGQRLIGHLAEQVLQKAVLAVLRRARVGLDTEDLLACE